MKIPHKHKDCIIAWANGAEIQIKNGDGSWFDFDQEDVPIWSKFSEYRIKPEPKPDVVMYHGVDNWKGTDSIFGIMDSDVQTFSHWDNQIKLTFDGETGALKSVEIIK